LLASGLSLAGFIVIVDPAQRGDEPMDTYALWIVAVLSWLLVFFFWSPVVARWRNFRRNEPVLLVDDQGMSMRDWRGTMRTFRWSEFQGLERLQRGREDELWFRAGAVSGAFPLHDLAMIPDEVIAIIDRHSERHR
jgi:hypothetical protein